MLRRFPNCELLNGSCYELPLVDSSVDVAIMADVIEHLESPDTCLQEICRVLRPKGKLFITTPKKRRAQKWSQRHIREFAPDELETCLRPHFSRISMTFFWPITWCTIYSYSRVVRKFVRILSRYFYNPFLQKSADPDNFGQILAVCQEPRHEMFSRESKSISPPPLEEGMSETIMKGRLTK